MTTKEDKIRARSAVAIELAAGRMCKQPCEVCGTADNVEAHHDDYSKPLDVNWLCKQHHVERHRQMEWSNAQPTDAIETALVWKCRICDHRWLVQDLGYPPVRCASQKCRSTAWYRPKIKSGRPKVVAAQAPDPQGP